MSKRRDKTLPNVWFPKSKPFHDPARAWSRSRLLYRPGDLEICSMLKGEEREPRTTSKNGSEHDVIFICQNLQPHKKNTTLSGNWIRQWCAQQMLENYPMLWTLFQVARCLTGQGAELEANISSTELSSNKATIISNPWNPNLESMN